MSTETAPFARSPRLNPFLFPTDTDFRFILLILSIVGASLVIYQSLYNATFRSEFGRLVLQCGFQKACFEPYEQHQALWMSGGVAALLALAGAIYWVTPLIKIRRERLTPLLVEDAPDLAAYLADLCQEAGLSRPPEFLLDALNPAPTGLAFGHFGRYFVVLSGGLVTQFYTDRPVFRAVVLHELAHLRNADVDKTYFAVAVWYAFVGVAFLPFMVSLLVELVRFGLDELGFVFGIAWRGGVLTAIVYLFRNAVLRVREFYADIRASVWDGPTGGLERTLKALSPSTGYWQAHPRPDERHRVLTETYRLFQMGFGESFSAGVAVAIAYENSKAWLMLLLPSPQENLAFLGAALLFAPLVVGVAGLGVWRNTFVALTRGEELLGMGQLGLGLALGLILGQLLSFRAALGPPQEGSANLLNLLFSLTLSLAWGILLLTGLFFFLQWVAASASVWVGVATTHRVLRLSYVLGLTIAGGLLTLWLGGVFFVKDILQEFALILWTYPLGVISRITDSPLTLVALISLWAFPLSAWFWRGQIGATLEWAFLDSSSLTVVFPHQPPLRPGLAILLGLAGGVLFCVLMSVILVGLHLGLSDSIRGTSEAKDIFLKGEFALAILIQLGIATITAIWARRVGWAHGLCAAFIAGCVMTIGALALLQLGYCVSLFSFGPGHTCAERVDIELASFFFGYIVNWGTLLAVPVAVGASTMTSWVRRLRLP